MKRDIKDRIVEATIRLIEEKGSDPSDVTVRDICREAGVAVSQINYHFQTKDNLIAQCVRVMVGNVIAKFDTVSAPVQAKTAVENLKTAAFATLTYLFANENISRISILTDHQAARTGDNTAQTVRAYLPLVAAACRERGIEEDPKLLTSLMVMAFQGAFLRADVLEEELGVNLRNEDERRQFLDTGIERIFSPKRE